MNIFDTSHINDAAIPGARRLAQLNVQLELERLMKKAQEGSVEEFHTKKFELPEIKPLPVTPEDILDNPEKYYGLDPAVWRDPQKEQPPHSGWWNASQFRDRTSFRFYDKEADTWSLALCGVKVPSEDTLKRKRSETTRYRIEWRAVRAPWDNA